MDAIHGVQMIDLNIPGWLCYWQLLFLECMASRVKKNGQILEIGALQGRSSFALASSARKSVNIVSIDLWDGEAFDLTVGEENKLLRANNDLAFFKKNMAERKIKNITPIQMSSPPDKWDGGKFDLIFVDGDHEFEGVKADVDFWVHHLKVDGLIFGDDCTDQFPGVAKAVKSLESFGYELIKLRRFWFALNKNNRWRFESTLPIRHALKALDLDLQVEKL